MDLLLITDRVESNLSIDDDKGNYNAADLNRVNEACIELVSLMKSVGYHGHGDFKTDWTMYDYPTKENTDNYLSQIYGLINDFYKRTEYALPEDMTAFTYEQANDIEKALLDIKEVCENIKKLWNVYSGQRNSNNNAYGLRGYCL